MDPLAELFGESPGVVALREQIRRLLARQSEVRRAPPVLLQGETGTGKGLVARMLHRAGPRADGPFIDVNCAAIPETLLEAEMFGFERGAFTDAREAKVGLFQAAHRGTIFLDEVALLPEGLQGKLLKVIEERQVRRLGSTRSEPVDVWVLAATSQDLETAARTGRFRQELYHRLAVVALRLPPLRERGPDILRLAEHFLARACADYGLPAKRLDATARAVLLGHRWPGNVRELANLMERAALLEEGEVLGAAGLALSPAPAGPVNGPPVGSERAPAGEAASAEERERLLAALRLSDGSLTRAAARLRIPRNTLRYRLEQHGLRPPPPSRRRTVTSVSDATAAVAAPSETPAASGIRWESRRLAFVRAAIVGRPDRDYAPETSRALEVFLDKVRGFGGRVAELSPTEVTAVFGLEPIEDAARRAALAAVAIQKALARAERPEPAAPPAVTVVLHLDDLMLARMSEGAEIPTESKRRAAAVLDALAAAAGPGTVLTTEPTVPFLAQRFELAPAGRVDGAPGGVYRLAWQEPAAARPDPPRAPFVGRRDELELLEGRIAAVGRGHGQVVAIVGEAGIGKSRLLRELAGRLGGTPSRYLEGRGLSYATAVPYLPVLEVLRQLCAITERDDPDAVAGKVRAALAEVALDPEDAGPYLLHLLGLPDSAKALAGRGPEVIQARTLETLRQLILKGSRRRPTVLAIEDLHWLDHPSEEFVASLVESLPAAPLLLVATYRPGYRPSWIERSYATQMALPPLSDAESLGVVRAVLATDRVADDLARLILGRAEGNPFFLEELSRTVRERGGDLAVPGAVPETIQAVLGARLDRLADGPRRLLQGAAVLGRAAPARLLGAMMGGPPDLDASLRELARQEFLHERAEDGERVLVFTHALTREVAYESLPPAPRQVLHAAAGRALEALYADRLADVYDRLAYHFARTDHADKAVEYLTRSGRKAVRLYAHAEAAAAFEEALRHVERLPLPAQDAPRIDIVPRLARTLTFLGRFDDAVALLLRQEARIAEVQNPWVSAGYYLLLAHTYTFQGDHERVAQTAHRAIEEARRCGDDATMGKALYVLAMEGYWSGRPLEGLEHGRQAIARLERTSERWWLGQAHFSVAANALVLGELHQALEAAGQAAAIGDALGDARVQTPAAWLTGVLHAMCGDPDRGIEACQRALTLAPDPLNTADALGWSGYVYLEKGDTATAIRLLEQSVRQWSQFRLRPAQGGFLLLLGEAYLVDGQLERALALATQGLELTSATRYLHGVGWGERLFGRIELARGRLPEAEAHFREARATFASIPAQFELARTLLDLARVVHGRGDPVAAAAHLAEARALLAALGLPKRLERAAELARALGL